MLRILHAFRLKKPLNRSSNPTANWWLQHFPTEKLRRAAHVMGPTLVALAFAGSANVAHAQGTISFSGAQTFMQTVQTFAIYAGAVICFGGLIFAGIRMMSGRFQDAIPGLLGALFGAGVLGWGAGWIGAASGDADAWADLCFKEIHTHGAETPTRILLPVRNLRFWIETNVLMLLKDAPFDKRNAQLVTIAGSCVECPKRTGHNKLLFADLGKQDACKLCGIRATASVFRWLAAAALPA